MLPICGRINLREERIYGQKGDKEEDTDREGDYEWEIKVDVEGKRIVKREGKEDREWEDEK